MHILVTGGAGYIGSHTCLELLNKGDEVTVVDDLSNASSESLRRVEQLSGKKINFHQVDILDKAGLQQVFRACSGNPFDAVIHFAGKKAVGESVAKPLLYYHNNITGTLNLLAVMEEFAVRNFVFSSSATVYGDPASLPISEDFPLSCTNPYGWTKLMIEQIATDMQLAHPGWNICLLRYFNPVGAHKSGLIGEDPNGIPNNLMPYISQVALGRLEYLSVFGDDYPTGRFPIKLLAEDRVISLPVMPIRVRPCVSWAGRRNMVLPRCVKTAGAGRCRIRKGLLRNRNCFS